MTLDHLGKLLIRLQALPLQAGLPVLEEAPRPAFRVVIPQLPKRFFQHIRRVQPLVRRQQSLQRTPGIQRQVFMAGKQHLFLPLDVAPVLALKARVFPLPDLVERIAQVTYDVKLVPRELPSVVEQDRRLRCALRRGMAKRLPP